MEKNKVKDDKIENNNTQDNIMENITIEDNGGEDKATFIVQVLYRQNSTWQGTVQWLEKGVEVNFRSAMELMQIIDGGFSNQK